MEIKNSWIIVKIIFSQLSYFILLHLETKSIEHREDINCSLIKEALTPLEKFKGGRGYLSVSDLTAQFWCEQQMEYAFTAPELKQESEPMRMGKLIHLERGTV